MGVFLLFMYLVMLPFTWLYFHLGRDSEARRLGYHRLLQRLAAFAVRRVPGVSFHLQNMAGETFERPAIVVCNHQSHLDLLCLMMLTPRMVFLTNDWVWHNPFYGMVVHRAEYYPVSNGIENHLQQLRSLYERGYSICVFPEGTRSADYSILRFHQGAFYLAQQLGADVVPVCLHGAGHVLPKRDFLLRRGRIDVEVGQRLTVDAPLLEFTRKMRKYYREHYADLCRRLETADYWRPYYRYIQTYASDYEE
jgi:1-acyl-sn-glycerol-3-phosphate acyltransferase